MRGRLERVNRAALRVAMTSTLIGLAGYCIISLVLVMAVTSNLNGQVDVRLNSALSQFAATPNFSVPSANLTDPGTQRFGPPLLVWLISEQGNVQTNTNLGTLPSADQVVKGPTTVQLFGEDVRLVSQKVGDDRLVVGQNVASIGQTTSTILTTELWAGIGLLLIIFFGAFATGRRVGAPIELTRQRQMEFTADASHELRTPLSVIDAQASLALAQRRSIDWYQNAFGQVRRESSRMRKITEDLLFLARVDQGVGKTGSEPVEVGVMAEMATERFSYLAEAKGITLTGPSAGLDSRAILASPEWLDKLLGVLLDNACKYSPSHGVIEVGVEVVGNRVRLTVEDSGPGIAEDEMDKIFNRFHRANSETGGSGLGLAIADAVVRQTEGKWEIGRSKWGGASMGVNWTRALARG